MAGGHLPPAHQPVGQVDIGVFQHRFQLIELGLGEGMDMARDEAADHQVGLLRAAVMRAEQQTAAAGGEFGIRHRAGI